LVFNTPKLSGGDDRALSGIIGNGSGIELSEVEVVATPTSAWITTARSTDNFTQFHA